jgi:Bacterial extracellular solute-binding protein, family 7
LFVAFVGISTVFSTSTAHAHGVTLKVHHFLPADSPFHTKFLLPWLAKLEEESHGLLRFQVSPAMEMGPLYDQVKDRTADIVWTAVGNPSGRFPAFEVFKLPLAIHSTQGSSRALWEYVQANDFARKEFAGVRLLAVQISSVASNDKAQTSADMFILAMNSEAHKSLSDELKKVILANSGAETSAWLGNTLGAGGGAPINQQQNQSLIDEKIKELDQRGLDGKALLESARALLAEFDPPK